jgi:transcription-repair coupling factor (superfamily II helicase)
LEFSMDAFLPEDYMPEGGQRLNFYRELVHAKELPRIDALETEVRDRFGRFPAPAQTLFAMARMRLLGERLGAAKIAMQNGRLSVEFPVNGEDGQDVKSLVQRIRDYPVEFSAYEQLVVTLRFPAHLHQEDLLNYLVGFVQDLAEVPTEVRASGSGDGEAVSGRGE